MKFIDLCKLPQVRPIHIKVQEKLYIPIIRNDTSGISFLFNKHHGISFSKTKSLFLGDSLKSLYFSNLLLNIKLFDSLYVQYERVVLGVLLQNQKFQKSVVIV